MEKTILHNSGDWESWYAHMVMSWGWSSRVRSAGNSDTPLEYPCLLVSSEEMDEYNNSYTSYDFIYKSDVIGLF